MTIIRIIKITSLLIFSFTLLSCTSGPEPVVSSGRNIEGLLSEAGFVRNLADSPEKMERIRSEIQRKVIPVQEGRKIYYLYADADFCRCLYVGDEDAFNRFETLLKLQNIKRSTCVDDRLRTVQREPWREFGELSRLCRER